MAALQSHTAVSLKDSRGENLSNGELWIVHLLIHILWKEKRPKVRIYMDLMGSGE